MVGRQFEKFRVGLFKEWHFSHHLIKTDPNSPGVRHVEVSLGTAREVNPVFCGREEGAKARMVINNTRPEYGLHHGHNIVLVTVSEVSAENLAMTSTVELLRRIESNAYFCQAVIGPPCSPCLRHEFGCPLFLFGAREGIMG
jgi:hypothetical protein